MRVQTVVDIGHAGICNCEKCGKYDRCVRIEVKSLETAFAKKLCGQCLVDGETLQVEVEAGTTYGKVQRKRSNKKAKKSEAKTAEETGGRCTGYFPDAGDSRNETFMFEDKTPTAGDRKSFRLTEDIVVKGRSQAQKAGLTPVFRIHLRNVSIGVMLWDDLISLMEGNE